MPFYIPNHYQFFPHPLLADEYGFLAQCDDLSPERLLLAYQFGIFPWYMPDQPLWWFFTHPRCVLFPKKVKVAKSMRSYINQNKYQVSYDTCFEEVITACQSIKRKEQGNTWIIPELKSSFIRLHEMGYAHSVEVWDGEELVGGLYGLALGDIFYGESMFARKTNASKFGLIKLCEYLDDQGYQIIDCQQETDHLKRMGAEVLSKGIFYQIIKQNLLIETIPQKWTKSKDLKMKNN